MNFRDKELAYSNNFNLEIVQKAIKEYEEMGNPKYIDSISKLNPHSMDELERAKIWIMNNTVKGKDYKYILDSGCGLGEDCFKFEKLGAKVVGVDKDWTKHLFCKKLQEENKEKNVEFIHSSILSMPFSDKWFDLCYSSMVLEHFRSPADGLAEMCRVASNVCGIIHMGEKAEDNPYHVRFLTEVEVRYLLDSFLEKGYKLEILDKYVFAMFNGKPKVNFKGNAEDYGMRLAETLGINSALWNRIGYVCKLVNIDSIDSVFIPPCLFSERVVEDYEDAIKKYGAEILEDRIKPITLVEFPNGKFRVYGDGSHRVVAAKRIGKLSFRALVTILEEKK